MLTQAPINRLATIVLVLSISVTAHAQTERVVTATDMPRLPYVDANKAKETFGLAAGFSIELVAAEPLVSDPVDACIDEFGRMYVAEMHGYPFSEEPTRLNPSGGGKPRAGIIRRLEDSDGDGRMDRSVVFADKLSWPTSVCCYNGGIFVLAPQHLYYLKDSTGDGKADVREVVLTGFGRGNVQAVTNGLQWGLDNRIYFAAGRNSGTLQHRDEPLFTIKSSDIRFDPRTESFETVTGGLQFGHTRDDWGTRFVCSNSNHMMQVVYPEGYVSRNPFFVASNPVRNIATDGANARVFRRSPPEPWRIVRQKWRALDKGYRLEITPDGGWEFIPLDTSKKRGTIPTEYPVGYFTSATGITVYRGDAYPKAFQGNAFIGDVGGNLIHRKTVDSSRVVYQSSRADAGKEIVASSDTWFRPVNFVNAPDGSLYVLDMYRETIEHPHSIPEQIKAFLDLSSGDNRGRIYRLVSPDMKRRRPVLPGKLNNSQLVQQLASANGWNRDTTQRLIWERQDASMVPLIEQLLQETPKPLGRLHSLNALAGLNALNDSHVQMGLKDPHPRIRQHAIRLSESLLPRSEQLVRQLANMINDKSEHVRFQLAFTLGEVRHPDATKALAKMCSVTQSQAVNTAILSSVRDTAGAIAVDLINQHLATDSNNNAQALLRQLAISVGSNPDLPQAVTLIQALVSDKQNAQTNAVLTALGTGLERRGSSIDKLLQSNDVPKTLRKSLDDMFSQLSQIAVDDSATLESRLNAVKLLSLVPNQKPAPDLSPLLSATAPQPLQQEAVRTLGMRAPVEFAELVLRNWRGLSPSIRDEAVSVLLTTKLGAASLLGAVGSGLVSPRDISRTQKQAFLNHRDPQVKNRSRQIFEAQHPTSRTKVVADQQGALKLSGTAAQGRIVFEKHCSTCHRVGKTGVNVAPDLASVKNKSAGDLLIAILDPNREALPNYNTYTVVTQQGKSYSGIIAAETSSSVTLKQAKGRQHIILRDNIEELVATGISLMPEGLEKDLSQQQLADVIAFVQTIGNAP